ncbi:unnamed protein product [Mytilus coruscus]|uniref:Uncharacterized protein n=1 Tax=Mytilus coruscus TaxID=42192 RepID=A0A6J8EID4_MYTCO|nr:unnamed protein product [Mytilus coruscus]
MEGLLINISKTHSEVTQRDNPMTTEPQQNGYHTNQSSPQNIPIKTNSSIGIQTNTVVQNRNTSHTRASNSSFVPIRIPIDQIRRDTSTTSKPNQNHENIGYTKHNYYVGRTDRTDHQVHFETVTKLNQWSENIKAPKLISCMQGIALDALGELAQDIKRLIRLAYPTAPEDVRDSIDYKIFRESLNNHELEWAICQADKDTIDEALNMALRFEAFNTNKRKLTIRYIAQEQGSSENQILLKETPSLVIIAKNWATEQKILGAKEIIQPTRETVKS